MRSGSTPRAEIRNCPRCGKLFVYVGVPICRDCLEQEEQQYNSVRQYLKDHPGATPGEISEKTGVPVHMVMEFLRRGLLQSAAHTEDLTCVICRKPITSGKICPECQSQLERMTGASKTRPAGRDTRTGSVRFYSADFIKTERE